jgi:hypothetical protein
MSLPLAPDNRNSQPSDNRQHASARSQPTGSGWMKLAFAKTNQPRHTTDNLGRIPT